MKKLKWYLVLAMILLLLTACNKSQEQSVDGSQYDNNRELHIGVIGEVPKIMVDRVKFENIQYSDLEKGSFVSRYDAIFIIQENMPEGIQAKYTSFTEISEIPFFFISMERINDDQIYATGFMYDNNGINSWGYGLQDNVENEKNMKDIYTRIFETISQNTLSKKSNEN